MLWRHCERFGMDPHARLVYLSPREQKRAVAYELVRREQEAGGVVE